MLPPKQDVFTTYTKITWAIEIENKEGVPYKIKLPEGTKVTISKYIYKPNCYFIESKLGNGWIYPKKVEMEGVIEMSELCQHFYMTGWKWETSFISLSFCAQGGSEIYLL